MRLTVLEDMSTTTSTKKEAPRSRLYVATSESVEWRRGAVRAATSSSYRSKPGVASSVIDGAGNCATLISSAFRRITAKRFAVPAPVALLCSWRPRHDWEKNCGRSMATIRVLRFSIETKLICGDYVSGSYLSSTPALAGGTSPDHNHLSYELRWSHRYSSGYSHVVFSKISCPVPSLPCIPIEITPATTTAVAYCTSNRSLDLCHTQWAANCKGFRWWNTLFN